MKKRICTFLLLCIIGGTFLFAEGIPEGFTALFNGKDFSGWNIEPDSGAWHVVDGSVRCQGKPPVPYLILTEKAYENFELYVDFKPVKGCNSGIFLHQTHRGWGRESRNGMEIQITDNAGRQTSNKSCGAVYEQAVPLANPVNPAGMWSRYHIIVNWPILKVRLNGTVVQDINLETHPGLKHRLRSGFIGLQNHETLMEFRNIYIKELPSSQGEWRELFNGKDLTGWSTEGNAVWRIENGILTASGGDGYLVSNESFENYHFRMFVKKEGKEGNSALFYGWKDHNERGYKADLPTIDHYQFPLFQLICKPKRSDVLYNGDYVQQNHHQTSSGRGKIAFYHTKEDGKINIAAIQIRELPTTQTIKTKN